MIRSDLHAQGGMIADAQLLTKRPGQVILFQKIMEDWGFSDQEAATLLGFEFGVGYRGNLQWHEACGAPRRQ